MRLSVSNLAWPTPADDQAFATLADLGVQGIEVAPTRLAAWDGITPARLTSYRARLEDSGLVVSSLQAILFGTAGLSLLGERASFDALLAHMRRVTEIAAALGAGVLVFGSPRNRLRGDMPAVDAWSLAQDRWREMGEVTAAANVVIGIEPVPPFYGGDFLTRWGDVLRMVREVDHPGVRVHLDTGCVALGGDRIEDAVTAAAPWLAHFHAAQPDLASFAEPAANHADAAAALTASNYDGWVAIEMREQPDDPLGATAAAVHTVQALYGLRA
jgi:sugar phosphate isomerase/epimerase